MPRSGVTFCGSKILNHSETPLCLMVVGYLHRTGFLTMVLLFFDGAFNFYNEPKIINIYLM